MMVVLYYLINKKMEKVKDVVLTGHPLHLGPWVVWGEWQSPWWHGTCGAAVVAVE